MPDITQGNNSEARLLTDERFLRKVAYMYYEDGHSQETIAEIELCSRQTVSKALQKAKDRGIVHISIVPDLRTGYLRNLSREVRQKLKLEDLELVPGRTFENVGPDETLDDVVAEIAKAAADYLDQLLTDSDILAVSGGRTFMRNVVRYLKPVRPLPHLRVVSTIGFVEPRTSPGERIWLHMTLPERIALHTHGILFPHSYGRTYRESRQRGLWKRIPVSL